MRGGDDRPDLDSLKAGLDKNSETLLTELFGEPSSRTKREWRWGNKGSVSVRFNSGRALFYSFEGEGGGTLLDAIAYAIGCDFPGAIEWARRWLGDDNRPRPALPARPAAVAYDADTDAEARQAAVRLVAGIRGDGCGHDAVAAGFALAGYLGVIAGSF